MRQSVPYFGPVRTQRDYTRMNALMESLLDVVGNDEDHELADLLDVVGTLIEQYEKANSPPIAHAVPKDVLKFLMEEHGLKQADLKDDLGGQGIVSEILSGKREINVRQAKKLATRFSVSAAVFI